MPSSSSLRRGAERVGYKLTLAAAKFTIPSKVLASLQENNALGVRYQLTLYSAVTRSFVGTTYTSPTILPLAEAAVASGSHAVNSPDVVFTITSIYDENAFVIIEPTLCVLDARNNVVRGYSLGWSAIAIFAPHRSTAELGALADAPLFQGSPRGLVLSPPGISHAQQPGCGIAYRLQRHLELRKMRHLVPDCHFFGCLDPIPGLKNRMVPLSAFMPGRVLTPPQREQQDRSSSIPCLGLPHGPAAALPLPPPSLTPALALTLHKPMLCLCPGYEDRLLRVITANREAELGLRQGQLQLGAVRIVARTLVASVHNGLTTVHQSKTPLSAMMPTGSSPFLGQLAQPGCTLLASDLDLVLSAYTPDPGVTVIIALEYTMAEPTATALGLRHRAEAGTVPDHDSSDGGVVNGDAIADPLASVGGGGVPLLGGVRVEKRRRVLVGRHVYCPYREAGNEGRQGLSQLVFANCGGRSDRELSQTYLRQPLELPLGPPNQSMEITPHLSLDGIGTDPQPTNAGSQHTIVFGAKVKVGVDIKKPQQAHAVKAPTSRSGTPSQELPQATLPSVRSTPSPRADPAAHTAAATADDSIARPSPARLDQTQRSRYSKRGDDLSDSDRSSIPSRSITDDALDDGGYDSPASILEESFVSFDDHYHHQQQHIDNLGGDTLHQLMGMRPMPAGDGAVGGPLVIRGHTAMPATAAGDASPSDVSPADAALLCYSADPAPGHGYGEAISTDQRRALVRSMDGRVLPPSTPAAATALQQASLPAVIDVECSDPLPAHEISITFAGWCPNVPINTTTGNTNIQASGVVGGGDGKQADHGDATDGKSLSPQPSATTRPASSGLRSPSDGSLVFSFQLYSLPHTRTEEAAMTREHPQSLSSSPSSSPPLYTLSSGAGPVTVTLLLDPTSHGTSPTERPHIAAYLATQCLMIEVWDAESLQPIGCASVQLSHVLRQQARSVGVTRSFEVIAPSAGEEDHRMGGSADGQGGGGLVPVLGLPASGCSVGSGQLSGRVVGKLLLVMTNEGRPSSAAASGSAVSHFEGSTDQREPPLPLQDNLQLASDVASVLGTRPAVPLPAPPRQQQQPRNGSRAGRVKVVAQRSSLTNQGDTNAGGGSRGPSRSPSPSHTAVVPTSSSTLNVTAGAASAGHFAEAAIDEPNAQLQRTLAMQQAQSARAAGGRQAAIDRVSTSASAAYDLWPVLGRPCFLEHTLANPTDMRDNFTIVIDGDGRDGLRLPRDHVEWHYFRSTLPLSCPDAGLGQGEEGPLVTSTAVSTLTPCAIVPGLPWNSAGAFGASGQLTLTLGPKEKVTIPMIYTQLRVDDEDGANVAVGTGPTSGSTLQSRSRRARLVLRSHGHGNDIPVVTINAHVTAAVVHRTIRYMAAEGSYLQARLPLPTATLPVLPQSQSPWPEQHVMAVPAVAAAVCPDPGLLLQVIDSPSSGREAHIRCKVGSAFPATSIYHILLYADLQCAVLLECWRIVVHAVMPLELGPGPAGQATSLDLVVRGGVSDRPVMVFAKPSPVVDVQLPQHSLTLAANALTRLPLTIRPLLPCTRGSTLLNLVSMPAGASGAAERTGGRLLVASWRLTFTSSLPPISRVFDLAIPLMTSSSKRIAYVSPWRLERRLTAVVSHPNLLAVTIGNHDSHGDTVTSNGDAASVLSPSSGTVDFRLDFRPVPRPCLADIFIYLLDDGGVMEDAMVVRVRYDHHDGGV